MIAAGVLSCLRELSRAEPVLVAVDDAQWLDASSAGALEFSLRRLGDDGRVVFLFSWRTDERGRAPIGGEGLRDGRIQRVPVGPLSRAETLRERLDTVPADTRDAMFTVAALSTATIDMLERALGPKA